MECCPICQEKFIEENIILVKHTSDNNIETSRKKNHCFHRECLLEWKKTLFNNNLEYTCPLDRDKIQSVHKVPIYIIRGLDLNEYDHNFLNLVNTTKLNDKMLSTFDDINETDQYGKSIAYYACMMGNYSLVTRLLKLNADFNKGTINGFTPLMVAINYYHNKLSLKLLSNKKIQANINSTDNKGMNAFYYSCKCVNYSIIVDFLTRKLPTKHHVRHALYSYRENIENNKIIGRDIINLMTHYLKNY
uniref:RING-type domain-containing protein n=1 Tax=viral metagenome TaxID=1070528 RepID=A0A6C0J8F5_9ZZZZ